MDVDPKTVEAQRSLLSDAAERSIAYLETINDRPVFPTPENISQLERALDIPLGSGPTPASDILQFIDRFGSPATVACAGNRYFGFVTGGALPATVAAHWMATAWDQNAFGFVSSPAIALFEVAALNYLKEVLNLPATAEGSLVTGATMANFVGLAAARSELLHRMGWDVESQGLFGAPEIAVWVSEEVHGSVLKVLAMLGLGRDRVRRIPVDDQGRMLPSAIPAINSPTIVCLQAGNVNSGSFDPAEQILPLVQSNLTWIHVDGAFGLWARATPTLAPLTSHLEQADSWATDGHKWLNVPYDCGAAFVKSPDSLRRAMSTTGAYLLHSDRRDAIDVTPDNSRRARAIDVWAALKSLGKSGIANLIDRNCQQAQYLASRLQAEGITVLNDVVLIQIVVAFINDDETERVLAAIQRSGRCWCGSTQWRGRKCMRISVSSWATTDADIDLTLNAILEARGI